MQPRETGLAPSAPLPFGNHDYDWMATVENTLEDRLRQLESSPASLQSLTGFDWIANVRLNAK